MEKIMNKLPDRNWGLQGFPESGKSTFLASNAETPAYVIDSDNRFAFVADLMKGKIIRPYSRAANIRAYDIQEAADITVLSEMQANCIIVDSVTKIYEMQSRLASMQGNMTDAERKVKGLSTNKASDQVEKANAMAVLRTLAGYGVPIYYVWHLTRGRNHKGQEEVRPTISDIELERLQASLAATLEFRCENKRYSVTVMSARDLGGKPTNVGFTIYDAKRNYWRGGAERLERLMYTIFMDEKEAVMWGMAQLGNDDYGEIQDLFSSWGVGQTWSEKSVAWIEAVDAHLNKKAEKTDVDENRNKAVAWALAQETGKDEAHFIKTYDDLFASDPDNIRKKFKDHVDELVFNLIDEPVGEHAPQD